NTAPQGVMTPPFNPNVLRVLASSDGGQSFGASVYPAQEFGPGLTTPFCANFSTIRCASPRLTVSQGTADGRVPAGQVSLVWEDFSQNNVMNADNRFTAIDTVPLSRGIGMGFRPSTPTPIPIADALDTGQVHTPGVTDIAIPVNLPAGFTTLSDLDVTLA